LDSHVVTRPYPDSNVGSNLASMAGAAWLARQLGRTLVVDWRGLSQLRDESLNYFTEFFAPPAELDGVPVRYAPEVEVDGDSARWLDSGEARAVGTGAASVDAATPIVLQPYHGLDRVHPGPEHERFRLLRRFYRHVAPAPVVARTADAWWADHCDGSFVVGVNVRTGNGAYFGRGGTYAGRVDISLFDDSRGFLRLLDRACRARVRGLPKPLRDDYVVFYATDSAQMSELLGELPSSATRRRRFPPPGAGDLYAFRDADYSDRDAIVDTLADMFLLARCDALVYNSSMFNQYARVSTGYFSGNHVHFESLLLRKRIGYLTGAVRRRLR
jgi:Nodulation protein Z (NodZ)